MPARRFPHGPRLLALFALLAAMALTLAACGSDSETASSSGPDPATVAPANAPVYAELLVRPSSEVENGVVAAARKVLLVQNPGAEVQRLIDEALGSNDLGQRDRQSYARDIEPWLGDRLGLFLLMPAADESDPDVAVTVAVRDREALDTVLQQQRDEGDLKPGGTYQGVAYDLGRSDDGPSAVIGDFLVVASTMRAFRAAVDASKGSSLADASRFQDTTADLDADSLAFLYGDPREIAAQLQQSDAIDPDAKRLFNAPKLAQADPFLVSLTARADAITLEVTGDPDVIPPPDAEDAVSIDQLPGDAWLAGVLPPLGPAISSVLESAGVHDQAAAQVRQALGLDLDRDLLDPLGGLGLFARGTNPLDIGGGALLQMSDAASAQRLMTRLQAIASAAAGSPARSVELSGARGFELQIPQSPQPIVVLAKGDRIAAGYAASSAQDLLDPQEQFGEGAASQAAIESLGDGFTPSLVILAPPLVDLLDSLDELEVAGLSSVLPYLRASRSLALGTQHADDRTTVRVVATLR